VWQNPKVLPDWLLFMLFFTLGFSYEKLRDFMRTGSSPARLLLKVLKEIYEVPKAIQVSPMAS